MFSKANLNKDFRVDSQFYTKAPKKNSRLKYIKIGDAVLSSQYGLSIEMNEEGQGFPIYRMNEIHDMLCDLSVNKYADITEAEYEKFALHDGDVLFNRTNSFEWVGRTGMYYQNDDVKRTFASYLVKFNPNKQLILPEYLCAFLNSKFGVWDIKRRARQSINQTNVNPEEVKEIEIPVLDFAIQKEVQDCLKKANEYRVESQKQYKDAENTLKEELGIKELILNNESVNIKKFKESFLASGRLDAEYYLPKYEILRNYLNTYKNGICSLSDIASTYRGNLIPDVFYCRDIPFCRKYIRGADISSNQLLEDKIALISNEFQHKNEILCQKDDIVFAMIGSVGTAALVTDEFVGSYVSNNLGIIRIKDSNIKAEYLHLLLTSPFIGALLFEQKEMRTAQPKISDKDIWDFPIPKLSIDVQQDIANYIHDSFSLRIQAKQLLEKAELIVEKAILQ